MAERPTPRNDKGFSVFFGNGLKTVARAAARVAADSGEPSFHSAAGKFLSVREVA